MNINDIRVARLRALSAKHGQANLATMLGYAQGSFLSHMLKENPERDVSEKTARRFERALGLEPGTLDQPLPPEPGEETTPPPAVTADDNTALVADVIRLVGTIQSEENVELPPKKFADLVALAYLDSIEHDRTPRPDRIKQLVRLLK